MKFLIKAVVTVLLFFLIFRNVDLSDTMAAASRLTLGTIFSALGLQLASNCVATLRWSIIMNKIGFSQPFTFYLKSFFKGTFFNQGLPTSIGGDGLRILDAARTTENKEDAFLGVFIDRIIGLSGLLLLNIIALLQAKLFLPQNVYTSLLAIVFLLLCSLVGLFFIKNVSVLNRFNIFHFLMRLSSRYAEVYSSPVSIMTQVGLSVFSHLLAMLCFYCIGSALGLPYSLHVYLALVPPVILLTILPISVAGWGLREGAMVGLFLLIGAEKAPVLSLSILYGVLVLAASLPGLAVFLMQKQRI